MRRGRRYLRLRVALTISFRNCAPPARKRATSAFTSSTMKWMRFQPPGLGRSPSAIGQPAELFGSLSSNRKAHRRTSANAGDAFERVSKRRCFVYHATEASTSGTQSDLLGRDCRVGTSAARGVRGRMVQALSGDRCRLAPGLGIRGAVLRVCARNPQDDPPPMRSRRFLAHGHQEYGSFSNDDGALALAPVGRMDHRYEPVRHPVRRALSGNNTMMNEATFMIAWSASSPRDCGAPQRGLEA